MTAASRARTTTGIRNARYYYSPHQIVIRIAAIVANLIEASRSCWSLAFPVSFDRIVHGVDSIRRGADGLRLDFSAVT